jgi:hypothetical protein
VVDKLLQLGVKFSPVVDKLLQPDDKLSPVVDKLLQPGDKLSLVVDKSVNKMINEQSYLSFFNKFASILNCPSLSFVTSSKE